VKSLDRLMHSEAIVIPTDSNEAALPLASESLPGALDRLLV